MNLTEMIFEKDMRMLEKAERTRDEYLQWIRDLEFVNSPEDHIEDARIYLGKAQQIVNNLREEAGLDPE